MAQTINPKWTAWLMELLRTGQPIDATTEYNPAAQWLVAELSRKNKPFKIYQIGAGVKRITTNTETCPCCKRRLDA